MILVSKYSSEHGAEIKTKEKKRTANDMKNYLKGSVPKSPKHGI